MAARRREPGPVESGVAIDDTVAGAGVLDVDGKRIFVPGVIRGEEVQFRRLRQRRRYDEAQLLEVTRSAASRVTPRCAVYGRCGGCSLQHLAGPAQLAMKQETLLANLQRIGKVEPGRVLEAISAGGWGYRRRARLAVRDVPGKGRVLVGFRERDKPYITDMQSCETLHPALARLLPGLSALVGSLSLRARLPQIELALADNALALVFRVLDEPTADDRTQLQAFAEANHLQLWLQPGNEESLVPLAADSKPEALYYDLPDEGLRLYFGPLDFIQVHAAVNAMMIARARELLAPGGTDRVLDLFSGIGNFSLPLARHAGEVHGFEFAAASVRQAMHNARANGLDNLRFDSLDLQQPESAASVAGRGCNLVLLDPPRSGAEALIPALGASVAERIVYVSCHPGTLARDAGVLVHEHGFRLAAAGVLDMFPQTAHVESMALFTRD